jgi:hypothetical protein
MGTTRTQEIRLQVFTLMALVVLAGALVISGAVAFGGKWRAQVSGTSTPSGVAAYDHS